MPSVKQGGGYTLTFAKKNKDVQDHLAELKKNNITITDYLCDAVRFYEKYKEDNINPTVIDLSKITDLIEKKFSIIEKQLNNINSLEKKEKTIELPTEEGLMKNKNMVGGFNRK